MEGRMVPMVIRMDAELAASVRATAAREERPMAQVIRRALRAYCDLGSVDTRRTEDQPSRPDGSGRSPRAAGSASPRGAQPPTRSSDRRVVEPNFKT